jgi:hypothetical protein
MEYVYVVSVTYIFYSNYINENENENENANVSRDECWNCYLEQKKSCSNDGDAYL